MNAKPVGDVATGSGSVRVREGVHMTEVLRTSSHEGLGWPTGEVGEVTMSPRDASIAGEYGTWVFRYVTGPYGVDDGGGMVFLFPLPTDRGRPQFDDPTAPNYCTVSTSGVATVSPRYEQKLYARPWPSGIAVDVTDGPLAPGDVVEFTLGDRTGDSPGARTQTFVEEACRVRVMVDPFATGVYYDVPGPTEHPVVASSPRALVAVTDSEGVVGDALKLTVRAIDRFGNVASSYSGTATISLNGKSVGTHRFRSEDFGVWTVQLPTPTAGTHRFEVTDADAGWLAVTNPIIVHSARALPTKLLWGDTQGQTGESVGTGTLESFIEYARDAARLDFVTHSANDFQVENDFYSAVWDAAEKYTSDGEFVVIGGFEWSGNTPTGGDHNVLYADRTNAPLMRSSHALINDLTDLDTDRRTVTDLNRTLRDDAVNAVCVAHVGGRVVELDLVEPDTTPALEIVSVHGWFEWLALEALQKGLQLGFVGASDDHSGRPGASYPTQAAFGVRSGLAAVRAMEFSRAGILDAIRARHCYATTGERIYLEVTSGEHAMGDKWQAEESPVLDVTVAGTAGIEAIDLMGAHGAIETWRPNVSESRRTLRVAWRGARHRYRGRTQVWDGHLNVLGANITDAKAWAFDHPDQGITALNRNRVEWTSSTNGDHDGIVLELDAEPAMLEFTAGGVDLDLQVADIPPGGIEIPLTEGLDRAVMAQWLPDAALPLEAATSFTPAEFSPGTNPYFIRIRQADGHIAWSSPIFVENRNPATT